VRFWNNAPTCWGEMPASSHKKKGISLVQNHQNIVYFMHSRQQNGGLKPVFCVAEFRLASPVLRIWKKKPPYHGTCCQQPLGHETRAMGHRTPQRGADQPNPRRTEFGHGTFCGIRSTVRLGLQLPSIFRRRRRFFGGFGLGVAQPGGPSAPAIFAQLLGGRGPLGRLPGGPNGPKFCSLWAAGDTARSRQDEPIERRPEEQGTQDAEKTNEGMRISGAMAIGPPSI
jgi:hypothetical protein